MAGLMQAYLDNSATTRPCKLAVERMNACMSGGYYNPSSLYAPAIEAERRLNACREKIRNTIQGGAAFDVIFTSGGTEANNLAVLGTISAMHGNQHVICSSVEHPAVLAAFEALRSMGHRLSLLPVDKAGTLDLAMLETLIEEDPPALISIMQVNNETGAIFDIAAVSALIRKKIPKCRIHTDAVQSYLRLPLDARGLDLISLSAHKIEGPKGIGALLVRKGVRVLPRQIGGGQENGLRSGTENTPGIAGMMGAIEHMQDIESLAAQLMRKKMRLLNAVSALVPDVLVNGPEPEHAAPHILNLSFPNIRGEVLLHALEADGVYCSTGSACSSRKRKLSAVLTAMGIHPDRIESALRFSVGSYTTDEEIDYAAARIGAHASLLAQFKRR